ncbi:MAG TPA: TerC/Alx family metal homeostasis membrane protein [Myxococcota bacterium]|nr:TerC/Alx family metal homeostasis membrane protein [Myxococcota bacterium]
MHWLPWVVFVLLVCALLALDLGVFRRDARAVRMGEALGWTAFYVTLGLTFNVLVYFLYEHHLWGVGTHFGHALDGRSAALQFFTGYLLEYSLSLDNVFVIALIFAHFRIPLAYQHRVLFWGVLGALLLRGVMIGLGAALIARFAWIVYVFGGILILTAVRLLMAGQEDLDPERHFVVRIAHKLYPVTTDLHNQHFFVEVAGRRAVTPLFLVLLMVESSDVLFAVDSIPAIFAVTQDPFLVFTSNVFAILGLRSLYFAIAPLMERFRYLKFSLVFILFFVGVKMILAHFEPIPIDVSLWVIIGILSIGVLLSVFAAGREVAPPSMSVETDAETLLRTTHKTARNLLLLAVGSTFLVVCASMVLLPGPGLIAIPFGVAMLGVELVWWWRIRRRLHDEVRSITDGNGAASAPPSRGDVGSSRT